MIKEEYSIVETLKNITKLITGYDLIIDYKPNLVYITKNKIYITGGNITFAIHEIGHVIEYNDKEYKPNLGMVEPFKNDDKLDSDNFYIDAKVSYLSKILFSDYYTKLVSLNLIDNDTYKYARYLMDREFDLKFRIDSKLTSVSDNTVEIARSLRRYLRKRNLTISLVKEYLNNTIKDYENRYK